MKRDILGNIHSIETFSSVDGPGIRIVIFMQGCSLKCKYCHNRDTWNLKTNKIVSVDEIINEINRYKNYIEFSNGGITVSGGEPLLQAKFILCLFQKLKKLNFHTALDTSRYVFFKQYN